MIETIDEHDERLVFRAKFEARFDVLVPGGRTSDSTCFRNSACIFSTFYAVFLRGSQARKRRRE